jgi:hypothetical protein
MAEFDMEDALTLNLGPSSVAELAKDLNRIEIDDLSTTNMAPIPEDSLPEAENALLANLNQLELPSEDTSAPLDPSEPFAFSEHLFNEAFAYLDQPSVADEGCLSDPLADFEQGDHAETSPFAEMPTLHELSCHHSFESQWIQCASNCTDTCIGGFGGVQPDLSVVNYCGPCEKLEEKAFQSTLVRSEATIA